MNDDSTEISALLFRKTRWKDTGPHFAHIAMNLCAIKKICVETIDVSGGIMDSVNRSEILSPGQQSASGSTTIETIKDTVAEKLHAAASVINEKVDQNRGSAATGFAGQAAGWLDDAAQYIQEVDPQKIKADVQDQVRRNPGRSLLVAGAAGLLLGILLRR